jgi:hypothetical protein
MSHVGKSNVHKEGVCVSLGRTSFIRVVEKLLDGKQNLGSES